MKRKKVTFAWVVSSLERRGGGERFVLEGTNALRKLGHDAFVVCERRGEDASFDGEYDLSTVICTSRSHELGISYLKTVYRKFIGIFNLYGALRAIKPEIVICQSEYDAIRVFLISRFLKFKYYVFVFGQMYQFSTDVSRYSSVFRKHLEVIVASRPGYQETVVLPPPRLGFRANIVNEVISFLKFRALNRSARIFTLSSQVSWEVGLLYNREAEVCRAAFNQSFLDRSRIQQALTIGSPVRFISVCRLIRKKRVDLTISAFSKSTIAATLTIVGAGSEEPHLRTLASGSQRASDIRFLGSVSDDVLKAELEASDCFISMDIGDYDISVVEAMGKGLRVIVASDFDMTDFGNDFTGVVSVEPDPAKLASAMEGVFEIPPPSASNLPILERLTWQYLAETLSAD